MQNTRKKFSGAPAPGLIVLAGGKSRRMGENKCLLPWEGTTLIEWALRRSLAYPFAERIIAGDPKTASAAGARIIPDIYPQLGPLAGIHAALSTGTAPFYLVVTCDTPFLNYERLLDRLLPRLDRGVLAVAPRTNGRPQPLAALYRRDCAPVIEKMLRDGQERKVRRLLEQIPTEYVEFTDDKNTFFNLNTPEDFLRARIKSANRRRRTPLFTIAAARSGAGKTTLIRALVPLLKNYGLRVGVIKSDAHQFQLDRPGKDTWHFQAAGADAVAIVAPAQYAVIQNTAEKAPLERVAEQLQNVDVVLLESRAHGVFPILEILRDGISTVPVSAPENLAAIITDLPHPPAAPKILPLSRPDRIAAFIRDVLTD